MATTVVPRARRVAVHPDGAHFASAFALPTSGLPSLPPEDWARRTFEDTPAALQRLLRAGWTGVLGLRLGPRISARHLLGWPVVESGPGRIALEARSPALTARNVVTLDDSRLLWATYVRYERRDGRARWAVAAPVHHQVVPLLLGRAVRRTRRPGNG
ncbi:DUF2867 domain-containing protein [Streptomyces sp. HMX87]|uniref:DUF2867 domain-containing protein n=1 Tax=Streptomyces sp. HMX87 TaxID=3390849 RepID=UPI003A853F66